MPTVNLYKLWIDGKSLFAMACFKWGAFSTASLTAEGTDEVIKPTRPGKCPLSWEKHFLGSLVFLDPCEIVFIVSLRCLVVTSLCVEEGLLWGLIPQLSAAFCLASQSFQTSLKKTGIYYHNFILQVLPFWKVSLERIQCWLNWSAWIKWSVTCIHLSIGWQSLRWITIKKVIIKATQSHFKNVVLFDGGI